MSELDQKVEREKASLEDSEVSWQDVQIQTEIHSELAGHSEISSAILLFVHSKLQNDSDFAMLRIHRI